MSHQLFIPEILFRILSCNSLSKHDLAMCCLVNHRWYDMALLCLWQRLELDHEGASQNHGFFSKRSRRSALIDQLAAKGHLVRTFTIPDCRSDMSFLRQMIRCMPRLETIVVDRVALGHYLSVLTHLVDESDNEDINSSSVIRTSLRSLRLPHVTEEGRGTEMLLQICRQNPGLRRLELVDSELNDAELNVLARSCPDLTSLDLSRSENLLLGDDFWISDDEDNIQGSEEMASHSTLSRQQGHVFQAMNDHDLVHRQQQCDSQQRQQQRVQGYTQEYLDPYHSRLLTSECKEHDVFPEQATEEGQGETRRSGISNTGFQRLFDSLYGYALRSINLEFTLIEDSGLLVLAQACGGSGFYSGFGEGYRRRCGQEQVSHDITPSTYKPTSTTDRSAAGLILTTGLTSICVNYCSKVTHEGIRALIDYCPRLELLEFVGCDAVSAQVFDPTRPWRCTGLKKLVFTLQPTVFMAGGNSGGDSGMDDVESVDLASSSVSSTISLMLPEPTTATILSEDLEASSFSSGPMTSTHSYPAVAVEKDDGDVAAQNHQEEDQQKRQREAIRKDYHAMFRQLRRLTRLESLHLYNSPSVNAHLPCVDEDVALATAELVESARQPSHHHHHRQQHCSSHKGHRQQKQPVHRHHKHDKDKYPASLEETVAAASKNGGSVVAGDDYGEGSSRRVSLEECSPSLSDYTSYLSDNSDSSSQLDTIALEQNLHQCCEGMGDSESPEDQAQQHPQQIEERAQDGEEQQQAPIHAALHPFTFHAGLKALRHLRQLRELTLYERATVVLGSPELWWMGKTFPCLQVVKLKGAIHPHGGAVQALALARPRLDIQVCRLFDE
ncbi:hypothetical protein BGZ73_005047 [Actinomortierella ambigua]|nr:hypothetical protein BGZ73_005047 [Actinomortierella ambigua]